MKNKKQILIVDDETTLAKALQEKFEKLGFNTLTARDGEEGLRSALKNKPNLIILDLEMPKKDGIATLCDLRKDSWGKDAKVVVLTNDSLDDPERVRAMVDCRPDMYLVKCDWSMAKLTDKVLETLND